MYFSKQAPARNWLRGIPRQAPGRRTRLASGGLGCEAIYLQEETWLVISGPSAEFHNILWEAAQRLLSCILWKTIRAVAGT